MGRSKCKTMVMMMKKKMLKGMSRTMTMTMMMPMIMWSGRVRANRLKEIDGRDFARLHFNRVYL